MRLKLLCLGVLLLLLPRSHVEPTLLKRCPSHLSIPSELLLHKLVFENEVQSKPWSKHNKYKITLHDHPFLVKIDNSNFEIVYHMISILLNLTHSKYPVFPSTAHNKTVSISMWHENVRHGWHLFDRCTEVLRKETFHVLYNDFLMGYSDRAPNCHLKNGVVVPIDQDSGSYTALLPHQKDRVYEKHILHNRMLYNDTRTCRAFKTFLPCDGFDYAYFARCLNRTMRAFLLHSTKYEHVLYRYNESRNFSCACLL